MSTSMTVSILIVNWNSKDFLRQCLLSIRRECAGLNPQIIVVDGGSFDGCAEMLASGFPEVDFVQSAGNVGFARANNLGLPLVTGDALWVLNPDTELGPHALQTLLRELEQRPDAGLVSPRLLNTDGSLQSSVHALPRPIRQALDSELLRRLLSPHALWAPPSAFAPSEVVAVEAVAGTAMLLRTTLFRDLGGFNPAYFMYAEDMDLCFRILKAGFRIYHVPVAEVVHHGGESSSVQGSRFSAVMMCEALNRYFTLNYGRPSAWLYRSAVAICAVARLLVFLPGVILANEPRRSMRKAAFLRWRAMLSWCCGGQNWTKRFTTLEPLNEVQSARS